MTLKRCFPPVVNAQTRLLVLGSLPGEKSLAAARYYAHPQNRFWHLLGGVLQVDLPAQDYETRLQTLLDHHVGLWDVVAEATRAGSLDSNIRDHAANDLSALIATLPQLRAVAFNGGTAARIGLKQLLAPPVGLEIILLPSSSPAHTRPFAEKLEQWRVLSRFLQQPLRSS
ncbi:DNA-deoxyinosine glycosylase [Amantichitinum ursilacus]|uniref:Uracil DNA glycosylase superfamily protein n=1 Tax=Amantichitinum ursilacus TaxID=857265 RepID=A0A0N0GNM9_9NEIS|nr:DNA-deoxyinosine glycosylase [Amantichitinum ursilacus]KPC52915.1 Uracil DNA glycosylase superfamily protein [Amantichitinum ursilacus]